MWHQDARFEKTDAGRQTLGASQGALARRERALLITVDGRSTYRDLCLRAASMGLSDDVVERLTLTGLIRTVASTGSTPIVIPEPSTESVISASEIADATASVDIDVHVAPGDAVADVMPEVRRPAAAHRRSLAAARMYLLDVIRRSFGPAGHPLHDRLLAATDRDAIEDTFDALIEVLARTSSPTMVAYIEQSFFDLLP